METKIQEAKALILPSQFELEQISRRVVSILLQ